MTPWIIERVDRKLADAIVSNIVGKCDESHSTSFDVLRVLCFLAYFTISVFDYTYWPCFEVKDKEDLLLEKTESTKPVEAKDRVNDFETCESDE